MAHNCHMHYSHKMNTNENNHIWMHRNHLFAFHIHFGMTNIKVISKNNFHFGNRVFDFLLKYATIQTVGRRPTYYLGMNGLNSHLNPLLYHNVICSDVSLCILISIFQSGWEKQKANDTHMKVNMLSVDRHVSHPLYGNLLKHCHC